MTRYEIGDDYKAWEKLVHEACVDQETGESKEPTEEEDKYLRKCFMEIIGNADNKFDNIGRLIDSIEAEAALIEAEKEAFYKEYKRIGKRVIAHENKVKRVKEVAIYLLDTMKLKKYKTTFFNFNLQSTAKSAKPIEGFFDADLIPVEFLKRELSASAIKLAVDEGRLYQKEEADDPIAYHAGALFYIENKIEKKLEGVSYKGNETLVIR